MHRKTLIVLFICSLVSFTISNGLMPILPVYTTSIGANHTMTGIYMSLSCLALALGFLFGGWMSDRYQCRKFLLIITGILSCPLLWMMGLMDNMLNFTLVALATWFMLGVGGIQIWNLVGLFSKQSERGKIFGIIASTGPLGAFCGGLSFGFIADTWGFSAMFSFISFLVLLWPLSGLLLEEKKIEKTPQNFDSYKKMVFWRNRNYVFLLLATLVIGTVHVAGILIRSLSMVGLGFSTTAISSTGVVAGIVGMPLPLIVGYLSDYFGRKKFLVFCYVVSALALTILIHSYAIWHFWIVISLLASSRAITNAVGSALITDLVPERDYGKAISTASSIILLSAIIGFAMTGLAIQKYGFCITLTLAVVISFLAIVFLIPIHTVTREVKYSEN